RESAATQAIGYRRDNGQRHVHTIAEVRSDWQNEAPLRTTFKAKTRGASQLRGRGVHDRHGLRASVRVTAGVGRTPGAGGSESAAAETDSIGDGVHNLDGHIESAATVSRHRWRLETPIGAAFDGLVG